MGGHIEVEGSGHCYGQVHLHSLPLSMSFEHNVSDRFLTVRTFLLTTPVNGMCQVPTQVGMYLGSQGALRSECAASKACDRYGKELYTVVRGQARVTENGLSVAD